MQPLLLPAIHWKQLPAGFALIYRHVYYTFKAEQYCLGSAKTAHTHTCCLHRLLLHCKISSYKAICCETSVPCWVFLCTWQHLVGGASFRQHQGFSRLFSRKTAVPSLALRLMWSHAHWRHLCCRLKFGIMGLQLLHILCHSVGSTTTFHSGVQHTEALIESCVCCSH